MPSIPLPTKQDTGTQFDAIMALKMAVEMMMGTRGSDPVSRTWVQPTQPTAFNSGDTWVNSDTGKLNYWTGSQWLPVT
jgi:hypothetical protein